MGRLINYLKDTYTELRHVSWPTQRQTLIFTVVVIAISLITAALLGFFDFVFTYTLEHLFFNA